MGCRHGTQWEGCRESPCLPRSRDDVIFRGEMGWGREREPDSLGSNLLPTCCEILATDFASLGLSFLSMDGSVAVGRWEAVAIWQVASIVPHSRVLEVVSGPTHTCLRSAEGKSGGWCPWPGGKGPHSILTFAFCALCSQREM